MSDSSKPSNNEPQPDRLREQAPAYDLELPVAPDWFSEEPKGSWEAGYKLSLAALRDTLERPDIRAARDREMVGTEFKM